MELSKQHFLNKVDCFIKVYEDGTQVPTILFKNEELKPLEVFFNTSKKRLDFAWYDSFSNRYKLPNGQTKLSTMFPDNKSEIGVAQSIKNVYTNNISMPFTKDGFPGRRFIKGKDAGGLDIEIEIGINNNILSGYPLFI